MASLMYHKDKGDLALEFSWPGGFGLVDTPSVLRSIGCERVVGMSIEHRAESADVRRSDTVVVLSPAQLE